MRISDWSSDVCSSDLQPMSRASGTRCVSFAFQPELIGILQVLTDGINLFDPFELTAVLRRCVEPFVKLGTGFGALVPIKSYNPFAGLLIDEIGVASCRERG